MSVRDGLLAILTLGPAYGSQLQAEFASRTPHRGPVNVGQIYQTLDRLTAQKLIEPAGTTDDGLPTHRLTADGRRAAAEWMSVPAAPAMDWSEMLDRVLVTSSIDDGAARTLIDAHRAVWREEAASARSSLADAPRSAQWAAAARARLELALAAVSWLEETEDILHHSPAVRSYSADRPRRGRRPSATPPPEV